MDSLSIKISTATYGFRIPEIYKPKKKIEMNDVRILNEITCGPVHFLVRAKIRMYTLRNLINVKSSKRKGR